MRTPSKVRRAAYQRLRAIVMILGLVLGSLTGVALTSSPAAAADGNILPPFSLGETWYVYQGYGPNAYSHNNNPGNPPSLNAIDLTYGNSTTASAGKTVLAPMSGTVYYYQASYGNLCVNTADGGSYTLTHISSSITSGSVTAGQTVGTVGAAGAYNNNGVAHIHFQTWSAPGCWANTDGGVPFDSAHGRQICGAPNMTTGGPSGGNGIWSGTSFTGQSCGSTTPPVQGVYHLYYGTPSGSLYETYWGGGNNLTTGQLGSAGATVTSVSYQYTADGVNHVFSGATNGSIHETYWGGGNALTTYQLASVGDPITVIAAEVTTDGVRHVFTATSTGKVFETYWGGGNALTTYQLTNVGSSISGLQSWMGSDGVKHLFFGTAAGNTYETYWGGGNALTTGQLASLGSPVTSLTAQIRGDGTRQVYAGTSNGLIYETYWGGGNSLTTYQLASVGSSVQAIAMGTTPDGVQHVYCGTAAGTVNETYWGAGNALTTYQLTSFSSAVTSMAVLYTGDGVRHVYSGTADGMVRETYWGGGNSLTTGQLATVSGNVVGLKARQS